MTCARFEVIIDKMEDRAENRKSLGHFALLEFSGSGHSKRGVLFSTTGGCSHNRGLFTVNSARWTKKAVTHAFAASIRVARLIGESLLWWIRRAIKEQGKKRRERGKWTRFCVVERGIQYALFALKKGVSQELLRRAHIVAEKGTKNTP